MRKEKLNSILAVNQYLIKCKLENPNGYKAMLAQQLLTRKVSEALQVNSKLVLA
jgi:hypothetical protein